MSSKKDMLYEQLSFYRSSYERIESEIFEKEQDIATNERQLKKSIRNLVDITLGEEFTPDEEVIVVDKFGVNLAAVDKRIEQIIKKTQAKIDKRVADPRVKEYLEIVITDNLSHCQDLEKDTVFKELLKENFHNDKFENKPYIDFFVFKYQPRYWKFKQVANDLAKNYGFEDYQTMFRIWTDLRNRYESLRNSSVLIDDMIKESERIKEEIAELEDKIKNIADTRLKFVKDDMIEILMLPENQDKLVMFQNKEEVANIIYAQNVVKEAKDFISQKNVSLPLILENMNNIETLIMALNKNSIKENDPIFDKLNFSDDPTAPVFKEIKESEWTDLKKSFEKAGIKLDGKREDYSVVETKVTAKQQQEILDKFGVEEGEIFFDPALANKKY